MRLLNYNSVDFGDLILLPIKLFKENRDILSFYQQKFKYTLVDEYQDTNAAQYMLLRLLTEVKQNICCVGDEDQSIYGWRGAQLKNILNFEKDFENSKIIRLEQNYRSSGNILQAASSLISENKERNPFLSGHRRVRPAPRRPAPRLSSFRAPTRPESPAPA